MANPTFNGFSLQDSNFITERIVFKGLADRAVVRANVNRREGIKVLATEFGEKEITVEGTVIASSASELQTLLDNLKKNLTIQEGELILEDNRSWTATVLSLVIPDEHYNQSKAPFTATFVATKPFSTGAQLTATQAVTSGTFTFSGLVNISGTLFSRPLLTYTPGTPTTGNTNIRRMQVYHVPTGQTVTISGFLTGSNQGLSYANPVTIDYDSFISLDGGTARANIGGFSRWEPGDNQYTITVSGRWPGGFITISYQPRYL